METVVTESRFQPKGAVLEQASPTTCILINLLSNVDYTDIEHVHIGLVVMCQVFHPCKQKDILPFLDVIQQNLMTTHKKELGHGHKLPMPCSFCLFAANIGRLLVVPTKPPYCLIYPTEFTDNTPQAERNHHHPENTLPRLHTRECMCRRTIHHANMALDDYTEYTGVCLLILQECSTLKMASPRWLSCEIIVAS